MCMFFGVLQKIFFFFEPPLEMIETTNNRLMLKKKKNSQTTVQQHQPSNGYAEKIVEDVRLCNHKLCKSNNNEMQMLLFLPIWVQFMTSSRFLLEL